MAEFGVIFDMDGVLVDSNEAHFVAFGAMAVGLGKPFTRELWSRTIGMHNSAIFPLWLGADLDPSRAAELAIEKEALYRKTAADTLKPLDGVGELIDALIAARVPIAVGSSGPRLNVELALKIVCGSVATRRFDAVVCGDDVKRGKPDPEIFLQAAERLGLPPSRCIVIEDAPQGVQAGLAGGMKVIGLTSSCTADKLGAVDLAVDSHRELSVERLKNLIAGKR